MTTVPQTSAFLWGDRHFPPAVVAQQAKVLQDSGVVDFMSQSTQMGSFIPPRLWRPDFCPVLIHEDENVLDRALDNPIVRWIAATFGRIAGSDWAKAGLASRAHAEVGYLWGTPQQVAAKLLAYAEAGVTFVAPADYLPVVCDPDDAANGLGRSIACLAAVKAGAA